MKIFPNHWTCKPFSQSFLLPHLQQREFASQELLYIYTSICRTDSSTQQICFLASNTAVWWLTAVCATIHLLLINYNSVGDFHTEYNSLRKCWIAPWIAPDLWQTKVQPILNALWQQTIDNHFLSIDFQFKDIPCFCQDSLACQYIINS